MLMHLRIPTTMPRREQDPTVTAVVRHILEATDHVGDTEQEREAKEAERPGTKANGTHPLAVNPHYPPEARAKEPEIK